MNEKITALVVTLDDRKTDALRAAFGGLAGFDVRVEAAKFNDCVQRARQLAADVAIIFLEEQPGSGCVILEEMKKTRENVFAFAVSSERSAEIIVKAIRAGADELISQTPTQEELLKALVKVVERRRISGGQSAASRVVCVYAPHAGVGTTTLAVNLAAQLHEESGDPVVLIDLDLQRADAAVYLNFKPSYTILDVCQNVDKLDNTFMDGALHRHDSGVLVLAAPTNIEDSEAVTGSDLEKVLAMLRTMYQHIVIDTSSHLNEVSLIAMEQANATFVVTDNMVSSIRSVQRTFDTLDRLGIDTHDYQVILNKPVVRSDINEKDIKEALKRPVTYSLPNDEATAVIAANQGVPLGKVNARSPLNEAIGIIAGVLSGAEGAEKASKGLFGRLF